MKALALVTILCLAAGTACADPTLQLVPSTNSVTAGDMVTLDLNIMGLGSAGAMEVGSFDSYIGFDPALLTPTGATFTLLLGDPSLFEAITAYAKGPYWADAADVSLLSVAELDALQPSSFTLATYSFTALASGTVNFTYLGGPVDNGNGDLIAGSKYAPVPEPPTITLLLSGLAAGWMGFKRRCTSKAGLLQGVAVLGTILMALGSARAQNCMEAQGLCTNGGAACDSGRGICETWQRGESSHCWCKPNPTPPKKCKDPGAVLTLTSSPITSFPASVTFVPDGNVTITGLNASPVNVPITGSMPVLFQTVPGNPALITAAIDTLSFSLSSILLDNGDQTGPITVVQHGPQQLNIDSGTGATTGGLWTRATNTLGQFETGAPVVGNIDFSTGVWTISSGSYNNCLRCDINGDGQVDIDDINLILAGRNTKTDPSDPRDVDSDGIVTANDARICVLACKNPHCAK